MAGKIFKEVSNNESINNSGLNSSSQDQPASTTNCGRTLRKFNKDLQESMDVVASAIIQNMVESGHTKEQLNGVLEFVKDLLFALTQLSMTDFNFGIERPGCDKDTPWSDDDVERPKLLVVKFGPSVAGLMAVRDERLKYESQADEV